VIVAKVIENHCDMKRSASTLNLNSTLHFDHPFVFYKADKFFCKIPMIF